MIKKNEVEEVAEEVVKDEITFGDPAILRPKELPLIVTLPEGASNAQIAYAKTINAYAYQNPEKFAMKKTAMIEKLKSLKNAPDPREGNLKINNSFIS